MREKSHNSQGYVLVEDVNEDWAFFAFWVLWARVVGSLEPGEGDVVYDLGCECHRQSQRA